MAQKYQKKISNGNFVNKKHIANLEVLIYS